MMMATCSSFCISISTLHYRVASQNIGLLGADARRLFALRRKWDNASRRQTNTAALPIAVLIFSKESCPTPCPLEPAASSDARQRLSLGESYTSRSPE